VALIQVNCLGDGHHTLMFDFQFHQRIHGLFIFRDQLTHLGFHFGLIMAWSMAVTSSWWFQATFPSKSGLFFHEMPYKTSRFYNFRTGHFDLHNVIIIEAFSLKELHKKTCGGTFRF